MNTEDDAIAARLEALTAEYHRQLPGRIESLTAPLASAHTAAGNNLAQISEMVFTLHKLAGSGATFGYHQLSVVARRWEKLLASAVKQHKSMNPEELKTLAPMVDELRQAAASRKVD